MNNVGPDFEKYGGSYLLSDENYEKYVNGLNNIGRDDGQFMIPSNQMDELISNHPNNPRVWENQLGLRDGSLGELDIHRVDVYNPREFSPRLPTSDLSGSNDKFIEGGKTPGGQDECVVNPFPNPQNNPEIGKMSTLSPTQDFQNNGTPPTQTSNENFDPLKTINNSATINNEADGVSNAAQNSAENTTDAINPNNFSM